MESLQRSGLSWMEGASDDSAVPVGRLSAGEELRRRREALGLDLSEVAATLRIKPRYLAALEAGRPEQLPGYAYALGFMRAYAGYLGLDAFAVLRRFEQEAAGLLAKPDLSFPMPADERRTPGATALLTAVILAICGYGTWYYSSTSETPRLERVAPVPVELLPQTLASPPAFGASRPVDRAGSGSDPMVPAAESPASGLPAAPAAAVSPAAPHPAQSPKRHQTRKH